MNDKTRSILDRFPDKRDMMISLMAKAPEFLAICEDHDQCTKALEYWSLSKEPEAESRANEYRNLIRELEEEIVQALAENQ